MARELKIGDIVQRWELRGTKLTYEYEIVSETKTEVKTKNGVRFKKKPNSMNERLYTRVGDSGDFCSYKLKQDQ